MKQSQFYYLLRRGLFKGMSIVREGLVMFNKFTTAGLSFPAQGSAGFNGTSDYIQVKDDGKGSAFDTQEFTIGAWVYFDTNTSDKPIWSYDFTSHSGKYYAQHLRLSTSARLFFGWNNGSSYQSLESNVNILNLNEWNYVSATFKSGEQKLYLNGSVLESSNLSQTITYYNQEVWIGRSNSAYIDGNLSNVAFWNRALSSDEINSVMWKPVQALTATESNGLQAWYSLDDIASPTASLASMEQLATDKDVTIENKAAITAAVNQLS